MRLNNKFLFSHLLVLVFIVSCGGGGGGGSPTPPEPSPTSTLSASSSSVLLDSVITLTWSSTNATSCSASGAWSGSKAISGTEDITISTPGDNLFNISCSGAGGSASASATVEGYRNTDGVSVDGYIRQADIFIDTNNSYTADSGEDTTTSDNDGKFTIKYSDGNLISLGGTDLDSGNALDNLLIVHKLTGHSNFKAVTPVTSVAAFMTDASLINVTLGIDASLDIGVIDPVAGKGDGGINDYLYEKGNQLTVLAYALQNITNNLNTTTETTQDYFKAIAEELDAEYAATTTRVNIETEAFITKVLNNIVNLKALTLDGANKANAIAALAAVLPVMQVKASDANTTAIFDFATSTLQADAQALANGTATAEIINSYQTDILNYVATDQNVVADELVPDITAFADSVIIDEDVSIDINVLANDSYNTTATLSVEIETPNNGSASISNNIVSYAPDSNFFGSDEITYTLNQAGQSSPASISITINSINDAPTFDNLLSTYTVNENQTAVTSIPVSDVENETLTVSLDGTDASSFNLSSDNILTFVSAPDYEEKNSYGITVSVTDGIDTLDKAVEVNLNNLNDNNPIIGILAFNVLENQTAIGNINATDADLDSLIYSNSGSDISISSGGVLTFVSAPDYETKTSYTTAVTVSDGVNQNTENVIIDLINENDNPTNFTSLATFSAAENQSSIGTVTATDADTQSLTFSVSGSELAISSAGVLTFVATPDYETKSSYSATVTASDGENTGSQAISVSVIDVNDNAPVFTSDATFSIPENQASIGSVSTTDADSGNTISYSVDNAVNQRIEVSVAANANGSGNVYVISGVQKKSLTLEVGKTYTFEHPTEHPLRFSATVDGTHGGGTEFTTGVDTSTDGITLLTVSSDTPTDLYYYCSIHAGMGNDVTPSSNTFPAISASNSGALTFTPRPDFETLASFSAKVTANDGVNTTEQDIQVNISDVEVEGPVFSSTANFTADENQTAIGTVVAVDPLDASVSYSLSGTDASAMTLDASSGVLIFNAAPDHETKASYSAIVTATGGITATDQNITVTINNLNDNVPAFTSAATFSAAENQTSIGTVTASDADNSSLTFSISGSDLAITSAGVLTFASAPDYETTTSLTATVTVNDGVTSVTQDITVTITDIDDVAPVITSSATFSAAENQTAIGTAAATDVDSSSITFSVSGSDLAITSAGVLTFVAAPDYETSASYAATLTATDGTNSSTQSITVNVTDINEAPAFTSATSFSAAENQTAIGSVTASDPESNSLSFSVSGSELVITSAGVLSFANSPDYETKSSYTATVSVTDGTNSTNQAVTITITNVNDIAPVFSSAATFSAAENQTDIGTVTATDAEGDAVTFTISGSELVITSAGVLTFASAPDYETTTSYTATVTATDSVNSTTQDITVSVTNLNDNSPVFTSAASFSAAENQTGIGTVTATDADTSDTVTFSVSGSELTITSAGVLSFTTAPDYETKSSYTATVTATDGTNERLQAITVSVTNLNDNSPAFTSSAAFSAAENQTSIGAVSASDADGDAVIYSISGTDAASISINSSSGVITFASAPDYETKTSYAVTATASDGVNSINQSITVNISDLNDNSPAFTSAATFSAAENQTSIGTVTATDADATDSITFSASGTELSITSAGVLTFASAPDYETTTSLTATVTATDGTNSTTQDVTVSVTDVNDNSPVFTSSATFSVAENQSSIGSVTTTNADNGNTISYSVDNAVTQKIEVSIAANSSGSGNVYVISGVQKKSLTLEVGKTYRFEHPTAHPFRFSTTVDGIHGSGSAYTTGVDTSTSGVTLITVSSDTPTALYYYCNVHSGMGSDVTSSSNSFPAISVASTGALTFSPTPNFEKIATFSAKVTANDGVNSTDQDITVSITDINDAPIFSSGTSFSAAENQTSIGTVTATDDEGDSITFSVSGSELAITSAGVLTFATAPDYETKSSYTATVTATDGTNSTNQDITVSVTNVNDVAPVFTSGATFSAAENQTSIGTVTATDAEGDSVTFSVSGSELAITSAGVLTFATAPDYETKSSYTASVTATDGTNSTTQSISLSVTDLDDVAPVFTSGATFTAAENQTAIGSVTATDVDSDSITFSVSGSELAITSAGVLTFATAPDYETKSSYTATLTATDGTNSTTQSITINITNIKEESDAPVISNFIFSPTSVDVTAGTASVTTTINITDASGVDLTQLPIPVILKVDGGGQVGSFFNANAAWALTSGTVKDGIYSATFTVPENQNTGSYYLWSKTIRDVEGNSVDKSSNLVSNTFLTVTGAEGDAPAVSNPIFSPTSVDVTAGTANVTTTVNVTDVSGIDDSRLPIPQIFKVGGGGQPGTVVNANVAWALISGTAKDGVYSATFTVPKDQNTGSYYLSTNLFYDIYNNSGRLFSNANNVFLSISGAEGVAPVVSNPSASPASVNVISNTATVTATIKVTDASGIVSSTLPLPRISKVGGGGSGTFFDANAVWALTSGTAKDGVYSATFTVPQGQTSGSYFLDTGYFYDVYNNSDRLLSDSTFLTITNLSIPQFTSNSTFNAAENQTTIGTVTATDLDGDALSFSISGTDASSVSINSSSGALTFNSAPDYETKSSYSLVASVTDGTNIVTQNITVNVTDVNEFTISGTAYSSRYMVIDSDVPNTANHSSAGNEYGNAQVIQNPIIVVGHTGNDTDIDGNSTTDAYDLFQVSLTNNMYVRLEVSEYSEGAKDLDLRLYETDGSLRDFTYASGSTEADEVIDLPSSGTILIQVLPVSGSSRYKLTLGQRVIPSSMAAQEKTEHFFIPNEFIKYKENKVSQIIFPEVSNTMIDSQVRLLPAPSTEGLLNEDLIKFDIDEARSIQNIKNIVSKDKNLIISEKQKEYLYHWKLKTKLESKFKGIKFNFNYILEPFANFSKDPLYSDQWSFPAINAEAGLNAVGQETKNIVVAVIDSGSPPTNSSAWASSSFISGGFDFADNDLDPTDPDSTAAYNDSSGRLITSHGTHVGTTIALKNDGNGLNGFGIKVLPIRTASKTTSYASGGSSIASIIQGIKYASGVANLSGQVAPQTEGPVKVINMSLGGPTGSCDAALQSAIDVATSKGITVVAAAGNSAQRTPGVTNFPAGCNNVISVANLTQENIRSAASDYNSTVDIAAPGTEILAWDKYNRRQVMSGTSMASPIVSAVIANMYSLDSSLTPSDVNTYITGTNFSVDIGDSGRDDSYGYGAIDFAKASKSVISGEGLTITYAYSSPAVIDFGYNTTSINVVLNKVGNGSLSVSNLTADNPTGLSYTSSVDSSGFGTYTIILDRTNLPNGSYKNVIYFNMSDGTSPPSGILYSKGTEPERADLGKVFIGLYNSSNNLKAAGTLSMNGSVAFQTTSKLPAGSYWYVVSTDIDNDGNICNAGEICEIYPTSDSPEEYIEVTDSDITGDAIYLRAISGALSGFESYSNQSSADSKSKEIVLPSYTLQGIKALDKPGEVNISSVLIGTPIQKNNK